MRVISGSLGGRKLLDNKYDHIRPTADIVKQAIFNKISFIIKDSIVLDLFCGTGALGIEALSRGAKEVIFVDKDKRSVLLTKNNLSNLKLEAQVLNCDFKKALSSFNNLKFNIIFVDPPYQSGLYDPVFDLIYNYNLLSDDGIIICEQDKNHKIKESNFLLSDEKIYGTKKVSYYIKA